MLEVFLVVEDQLGNHSFVDLCRRELVLGVLYDDGGQLGEVLRNLGSTCLHDKVILGSQLLQELNVLAYALK